MPEARIVSYRALIVLALFLSACASSGPASKITDPDVEIEQVIGPAELSWPYGPIDLKYAVQVTNKWTQPITFRGIAYFDTTVGPYQKVLMRELPQGY